MKKQFKLEVGVKSIIVNKNKDILVIKRNPAKYPRKRDLWDIPGGRVEIGKSLLENLSRETREETGISRVTSSRLLAAQDIFWKSFEGEDVHLVRLTYISYVTMSKVRLSVEHTEYKWVKLADLLKIKDLDRYLKQILKDKTIMSFIQNYIDRE